MAAIHDGPDAPVIPAWLRARVPGLAQADVQRVLADGPVSTSWLVRGAGGLSVLRIDRPLARRLGLDRATEARALGMAAAAGLGPRLQFADHAAGVLLTAYVPGRAVEAAWLGEPAHLRRVGELFGRLHALPGIGAALEPGHAARRYAEVAGGAAAGRVAAEVARLWARRPPSPVARPCLCHHDVHAGNLVQVHGGGLALIDWEYAGAGCPAFDLAILAEYHRLDGSQVEALLGGYAPGEGAARWLDSIAHGRSVYQLLDELWNQAVSRG